MALLSGAAPVRVGSPVVQAVCGGDLDSVQVLRRIAAHLPELDVVEHVEGRRPAVALVCGDRAAAERFAAEGVPVVFVHTAVGLDDAAAVAVECEHRPGWLPGGRTAARAVGSVAPVRLRRAPKPAGVLVLLAVTGADAEEVAAQAEQVVAPLLHRWPRPDRTVVADGHWDLLRTALPGVEVRPVDDSDVDQVHAGSELLVASPSLAACALAHVRRAPLVLLPPLDRAQAALLDLVRTALPVPVAGDRGTGFDIPWSRVNTGTDDLRGAQRVARFVRQLALAP